MTPDEQGLGIRIFERLRAEHEPWAQNVFIKPDIFPLVVTSQSMIISGEKGSGKTMLRIMLANSLSPAGNPPHGLVVNWFPEPPENAQLGGSDLSEYAFNQAMIACLESLIPVLGKHPTLVQAAPVYAKKAAAFFFQEYLPGDPQFFIELQAGDFSETGTETLREILRLSPGRLLDATASHKIILTMFVKMLENFGLHGAWILMDGFENWPNLEMQRLGEMFNALWSTMAVLDVTGFIHKVFTPDALLPHWKDAGGVITDRLQILELRWTSEELQQIINRRLAAALGYQVTRAQLSRDPEFLVWIERQTDHTPRSHLLHLARFLPAYVEKGRPLEARDWHPIANYTPELLSIDLESNTVYIGTQPVKAKISKPDLQVLIYLYKRRDRFCTKEELYYCALNQHDQVPQEDDADWRDPNTYRDGLYNRISRLRKALNPTQRELYIFTESGEGYRLINAVGYRDASV